jgi:hypothetical protein
MKIYEEYPYLLDPEWVEGYDLSSSWTAKNPGPGISDLDCAVALLRTGGVLSDAAKLLNRSRTVISSYIANTPHILELAEEVVDSFLDAVEKLQKDAALAGDSQAQRFILTTLGKRRGYTTRTEAEVEQKTKVIIGSDDAGL